MEIRSDDEGDCEEERLIHSNGDRNLTQRRLHNSAPHDRYYAVYGIFFLLGIGSLLPWNFFSNAKQYFIYKLRNATINGSESWTNTSLYTNEQIMFENYLELAALVPSVIFMFINMLLTKIISSHVRIIIAVCTMIILFLMTVILTQINTDRWQYSFLVLSLLTIVIMNAGSAVLQGAICGLAGRFPKAYMQAVLSGMGMGGLLAALANLMTVALSASPIRSGFIYFLIAEVVLILCLLSYLALPHMNFVRFYIISGGSSGSCINVDSDGSVTTTSSNSFYDVFKKIWVAGGCVFFVFAVTLSCYPALISAIESSSKSSDSLWTKMYFTPVVCFVFFNLMDFLGRNLAGVIQWPRDTNPVFFMACLLRAIFILLFLMCNVQPRHNYHTIPFNHDAAPILLTCLFGITNGYMGTLSMMHGPRKVRENDVEVAGSMMAFMLSAGLGVGALISMLLISTVL